MKSTPVITQFTIPTAGAMPTAVAMGADGSAWFASVVNPTPAPTTLQVGRLGTGVGPIVTVKVSGTAKVGSALTCSYINNHGGPPANARYQWMRGGKAIANQTAKKFTPRAGDVDAKVSCRVVVTYSGALNQVGAIAKSVQVKG